MKKGKKRQNIVIAHVRITWKSVFGVTCTRHSTIVGTVHRNDIRFLEFLNFRRRRFFLECSL